MSRKDAFVDYVTEIEADTAQQAVNIAHEGGDEIVWEEWGTVEFDARHVVAVDENGWEIENTARGDFT